MEVHFQRARESKKIYHGDNHVAESFGQASNKECPVGSFYYASATANYVPTNLP
jgi:hypothetical protein